MSVFGVILVHFFPAFSHIRSEYGERGRDSISPYLVRMREKCWPEYFRIRTFFTQKMPDLLKPVFSVLGIWIPILWRNQGNLSNNIQLQKKHGVKISYIGFIGLCKKHSFKDGRLPFCFKKDFTLNSSPLRYCLVSKML